MKSSDGGCAALRSAPAPAAWPRRHFDRLHRRVSGLPPTARGLMWSAAAGLVFSQLNALMRLLTLQLEPFETQFLRYFFGMLVMLPLVLRGGWRNYSYCVE